MTAWPAASPRSVLSTGKVARSDCLTTLLITVGWAALAATFTFSIAMVVWGRNGDGTLNF
jgi:cytochrome b6-f complex subunit 8